MAWLNELLYLHEVEDLLFASFSLSEVTSTGLVGRAKGERCCDHHTIKTAVKAATYHLLEVKKKKGGWQAQVIFDI